MEFQGQIKDTNLPIAGTSESPKSTIVLVHGAFEDASIWNGVIERLQRDGYSVVAFGNPLLGPAIDSAYLRSLLSTIQGPVILAAHSYGGAVITQPGPGPIGPGPGPCAELKDESIA